MPGCEETCPLLQKKGAKHPSNCHELDPSDGLPVQCVGEWAETRKHDILRRLIHATRGARSHYLPGRGSAGGAPRAGGAAYIDLFAGPGRARVRETSTIVNGSPLIAVNNKDAPFTDLIFCDLEPANIHALKKRTSGDTRVTVVPGDCNKEIDRIVAEVPRYGLNFTLYDPYGPAPFDFSTIEKLARASDRMDLLVNFPTGPMKRNIANRKASANMRAKMSTALGGGVTAILPRHVPREIETFRKNLAKLGYTGKRTRVVAVTNGTGALLYHLVYASRHDLGDDIWNDITKPKDQREWAF